MVLLHQFELSPFCDKIRRILRYKGIAFDVRNVAIPDVAKVSPHTRKLPVLQIEGETIADSTQIALEIERRFPEPPLYPADERERALCHVFEDWADESLYFYEIAANFNVPGNLSRRVAQLTRNEPRKSRWWAAPVLKRVMPLAGRMQGTGRKTEQELGQDVERHFAAIEGWLGTREWLVASHLTVADIAVHVQLDALCLTELAMVARDRHLPVAAWMERVREATGGWRASDG